MSTSANAQRQRLLSALLVADLLLLVWLVWTPGDLHACKPSTVWAWLLCADSLAVHYGANVLLLAPTAVIAALLWPQVARRRIAIAMLLLTCAIEVAQRWIPGRDPDIRDVIANTAGAWLALTALTAWQRRSPRGWPAR